MSVSIRPEITKLQELASHPPHSSAEDSVIAVSSATRRIAFAYERFRNTLEPDEEDILRRKAIYRILDRRVTEDRPPRTTAIALLQELIRASYIEVVPSTYAERIEPDLRLAIELKNRLEKPVYEWLLQLLAVSIDRRLYPREIEEATVRLLYQDAFQRTVWTDNVVATEDQPIQLYIACHRGLFAADDFEITFHYFKYHFPHWESALTNVAVLQELVRELPAFYADMQRNLHHPARQRLTRLVRPAAVPYRLLLDQLKAYQVDFTSLEALEETTRSAVQGRMQRIRDRMNRRAWNSILFLFLTKGILSLLFEVPYELLFLRQIHWLALASNIAFHPLLLFVLATSARLPGQRNADVVVDQVRRIVTDEELPTIVVSAGQRYGALTWSVFAFVYAVLFMGIFWGLFSILTTLEFSLPAMFLFVIFLGLVSFLAARIRRATDEIRVVPRSEGALATIGTFLALPILEFGRWLTEHASELNVPLILMDRVLEAPFKILIDVIEEWFAFVRERREEIV